MLETKKQKELWWGPWPNPRGLVGQPETPRILLKVGGGRGSLKYGAWWVPTGIEGSLGGEFWCMNVCSKNNMLGISNLPGGGTG